MALTATQLIMADHLATLVDVYIPQVDTWNKSVGENDTKFAQWLESVERTPMDTFTAEFESLVRSSAAVGELAAIHDWAKSLVKLTQDMLTTQMFVANHSATETTSAGNADLISMHKEITQLFDFLRKTNANADDLMAKLPVRMAKAPKSGKMIPKLNVPKPKSERKQVRENSTFMQLSVDGVIDEQAIGLAITAAFGVSLNEFQDYIKATHGFDTIYDIAEATDDIECYGKVVDIVIKG